MSKNIFQCRSCGYVAAVSHPAELSQNGWVLEAEGKPATYCSECARKLKADADVTPPPSRTKAAGSARTQ
jgi:hypothetical protein